LGLLVGVCLVLGYDCLAVSASLIICMYVPSTGWAPALQLLLADLFRLFLSLCREVLTGEPHPNRLGRIHPGNCHLVQGQLLR
jgi:hypothetical protein